MAKKKKRYRGHYCWVCESILPNERFSGKGHSKHICKQCQKLSPEELRDAQKIKDLNRKFGFMSPWLKKQDISFLQGYLNDPSEKVRAEAQAIYNMFLEEKKHAAEFDKDYDEDIYDYECSEEDILADDYYDMNLDDPFAE